MNIIPDSNWTKRGVSFLWDASALSKIVSADKVVSLRQLFTLAKAWPEDLPAADGKAIVVAGLDGCLDVLTPDDCAEWLESDLKNILLSFQDEYENQAALIFWLPSGKKRIKMSRASELYTWLCSAPHSSREIEIGRCIWGGAQSDIARIIISDESDPDVDGPAWIGLHHPRSS